MKTVMRNILALLAGLIVGSIVNMLIVNLSGLIIPPPEGADTTTMEGLAASMPLFQPKHFLMPFLAHALGTLVGAFLVTKIAISHQFKFAIVVGLFFLIGGTMMVIQLPSPMWFNALDLIVAYVPMGYLGWRLAKK